MSNTIRLTVKPNFSNGMTISDGNNHNTLIGNSITIDWGDGTIDNYNGTMYHEYTVEGTYNATISNVEGIGNFFLMNSKNISKIEMDDGISAIGSYFLMGSSGIETLKLPNNLTSIGYYFLSNCSDLVSLELPETLTSIGNYFIQYANFDELVIPSSVTTIGNHFCTYSNIKRIILSNNLTSIGDSFLEHSGNLEKLDLPDSLRTIGDGFMKSMTNLSISKITIPSNVETIGSNILANTNISIVKFEPETPPTLKTDLQVKCEVYDDCIEKYIETPYYPKDIDSYNVIKTIGTSTRKLGKLIARKLNKYMNAEWFEGLTTLSNKTLDVGAKKHITFENNIGSTFNMMGDNGDKFSLTLPNNVEYLRPYTPWKNVTSLTIPETVKKIHFSIGISERFGALEKLRFKSTKPPQVIEGDLLLPVGCVIEVPCGALSSYQNSPNYPSSNDYTYKTYYPYLDMFSQDSWCRTSNIDSANDKIIFASDNMLKKEFITSRYYTFNFKFQSTVSTQQGLSFFKNPDCSTNTNYYTVETDNLTSTKAYYIDPNGTSTLLNDMQDSDIQNNYAPTHFMRNIEHYAELTRNGDTATFKIDGDVVFNNQTVLSYNTFGVRKWGSGEISLYDFCLTPYPLKGYFTSNSPYDFIEGDSSKLSYDNDVFKCSTNCECINTGLYIIENNYTLVFDWKINDNGYEYNGGFSVGNNEHRWTLFLESDNISVSELEGDNEPKSLARESITMRLSDYVPVEIIRKDNEWTVNIDNEVEFKFTTDVPNCLGVIKLGSHGETWIKNLGLR